MKIYHLFAYALKTGRSHYNTLLFNSKRLWFDVKKIDLNIYSSIEAAEKVIQQHIKIYDQECKDWRGLNSLVGFRLYERNVDEGYTKGYTIFGDSSDSLYINAYSGIRTYLADGTLYIDFPYDDLCTKGFRGCKDTDNNLKPGEYGLVLYNDVAEIVKIRSSVPTRSWWKAHIKKDSPGDESDCCYTSLRYQNDHDHPEAYMVFPISVIPPSFKKLNESKKKLDDYEVEYDKWLEEENRKYQESLKNKETK